VAAIASRQRGRAARWQLRTAGLSDSAIDRMAARGYLIREHRGVYVVGHTAPTPLGPETGALLACGHGAVLSHFTAARMWNLLRRVPPDAPVDVTVIGRHGPSPSGVRAHRASTLIPADVRIRDRLAVTAPARTALDLADVLDQRDLEWSVDEALQRGLVTKRDLAALTARAVGRRGGGRLARALARHSASGITRSEAEKRFRDLVRAAGLPQPRSNIRLHGYEVDFYWPAQRLVVEIDGYRFHSSRPKIEHDTSKAAALVAAGLQLMRFTALQLCDRPLVVTARVAQALARADAHRAA
jgi:very-short-patch-repair endonuclease